MINQDVGIAKRLSLLEKTGFPWRKSRLVQNKPAFFPGCNLVNFLPGTAREVTRLFGEQGAGWLYDCCSKPLQLAGDEAGTSAVLSRINRKLKAAGVTELIAACPNCLSVFQKGLEIPVKDIYTYLKESNIPCGLTRDAFQTFPPCPDRKTGAIQKAISAWTGAAIEPASGLPCCGLGIADPNQSGKALKKIQEDGRLMRPYCASCQGHLSRHGVKLMPHVLTEGLGLSENTAQGFWQGVNRMRPWFWG